VSEDKFKSWPNRLSLDWLGDPAGMDHSIFLFQEASVLERIRDLRIWFRESEFTRPDGTPVHIADVLSGGKRWWDGLYAGDKRTEGHGILPGKPDCEPPAAADGEDAAAEPKRSAHRIRGDSRMNESGCDGLSE